MIFIAAAKFENSVVVSVRISFRILWVVRTVAEHVGQSTPAVQQLSVDAQRVAASQM